MPFSIHQIKDRIHFSKFKSSLVDTAAMFSKKYKGTHIYRPLSEVHEVVNYNVKVMTAVYKRHFQFLHSLSLPSLTRSHPRKPDETKCPS